MALPRKATLHMRVTTPLFNGGATPLFNGGAEPTRDDGTGIRVPSIRGAMRFWFRALAGVAAGPNLKLLAKLEADVFGSAQNASPVALRIPRQPSIKTIPDFGAGPPVRYLLGQGLWDTKNRRLTRPFVPSGQKFELEVRFAHDRAGALALASLWLLSAYGGIGARTRRGFGGVRILDAKGDLPSPWDATKIKSPPLDHYLRLTRLWPPDTVGRTVVEHLKPAILDAKAPFDHLHAWSERIPTYPVLSKTHTKAAISKSEFQNWEDVLSFAGEKWQEFRSRQERIQGERFRPGALGLPVVFGKTKSVNADKGEGEKAEQLRRASPVWLRPVGDRDEWRLFSFAFLCEFLPQSPQPITVHIWKSSADKKSQQQDKKLKIHQQDVEELVEGWLKSVRTINRQSNQ